MNFNKAYLIFKAMFGICWLFLLSACYQDIDLDKYKGQNGENLLVINSIVNPDSTVAVVATKTYFFSDLHTTRDYVNDLAIRLSINGEDKGVLTYNSNSHYYESTIKPKENDNVCIETQYGDSIIKCGDIIPPAVEIKSIEVEREGPLSIYTSNDYIVTYKVTFEDPVGKGNYYFLHYDTSNPFAGLPMGERDYSHEIVFQKLANTINSTIPGWEPYSPYGLPFTDEAIDGKAHTLILREIVQGGNGIDLTRYNVMSRKIKLFSISEDYYKYLLSVLYNSTEEGGLHSGMIDLGITEPMKYFSNIKGGVGIFAGYSLTEREIDVMEILGRFP